jgi:hypothetical protein
MKIKIIANVYYTKYSWEEKGTYEVFVFKIDDTEFRTFVNSQEIEIEVPETYDPRQQQIISLEKEKERATAEYQKAVSAINDRISKLLAIGYSE